jgi:hypothetical protein
MKRIFRAFASLVLASVFCFQAVNACTIKVPPFRKEFRRAESVFTGKVVKIVEAYSPTAKEAASFPEGWESWKYFSKITFEVKHKWKGDASDTREFVAVAFFDCGCPGGFDAFKTGEEFLVFADEKNFVWICDSYKIEDEWAKDRIKRLDSFWFRAWARVYPF